MRMTVFVTYLVLFYWYTIVKLNFIIEEIINQNVSVKIAFYSHSIFLLIGVYIPIITFIFFLLKKKEINKNKIAFKKTPPNFFDNEEICSFCSESAECLKLCFHYGKLISSVTNQSIISSINITNTNYEILGKKEFYICINCLINEEKKLWRSFNKLFVIFLIFPIILISFGMKYNISAFLVLIGILLYISFMIILPIKISSYQSYGNFFDQKNNLEFRDYFESKKIGKYEQGILRSFNRADKEKIVFWTTSKFNKLEKS